MAHLPRRFLTSLVLVGLAVLSGCGSAALEYTPDVRAAAVRVILGESDSDRVAPNAVCISLEGGTGRIGSDRMSGAALPETQVREVVERLGAHDPPFRAIQDCGDFAVGIEPEGGQGRAVVVKLWEPSVQTPDSLRFEAAYFVGPLHARGMSCLVLAAASGTPECSFTWIS